jgi:hypothetical protein
VEFPDFPGKTRAGMKPTSGTSTERGSIPGAATFQDRVWQAMLMISTLLFSWLGMMLIHEFGHVLFAWLSGGAVARVVLAPLEFSRTDLQKNPHPLFVACGGALVGSVLPILVLASWRKVRVRGWYIWQFLSGFCLIANGIYLAVVCFFPNAADPGDLMREGCPRWVLILFGVVAFPCGLFLWNGLGVHFGLGKGQGRVDRLVAIVVLVLLMAMIVVEVATYAG